MPITVEWDGTDKAAIRVIYETPWMWDDFDVMIKEAAVLASEVDYKVCLIHDAEKSTGYPTANVLPHYQKVLNELAPYVKLHIGVGTISFTKKLVTIILSVMGGTMEFVGSLEEARQMAAEAREN